MVEDPIEKVLGNVGLTDAETAVYIFLAKHGILTNREIARHMKKDRAQVLRVLKKLQAKSLVEATLEVPTRYSSIPFDQVIDLSIKTKRDEAAIIESAKNELLNYWKRIGKTPIEPSPERFMVIEGDLKIFSKIAQMARETKSQLSWVSTVPDLLRGTHFGVFETVTSHPLRSKIQFRFLTELSNQNAETTKALLRRTVETAVNIKGRNPDLGLRLFPRMVIRDHEEILFFFKHKNAAEETLDLCLWTNCADLVEAFTSVFEDLWRNSADIQTKIKEIEAGKHPQEIGIIKDAIAAQKKYIDTLRSAEREIIILTSSEGLLTNCKNIPLMKELAKKCVSTKIMAPITSGNLQAMQELSQVCSVKHISSRYLGTTVVDGKHLFQFKEPAAEQAKTDVMALFENTFYTNDQGYVEKAKNMLDDVWKNAYIPSALTLESILREIGPSFVPLPFQSTYARKLAIPNIINEAPSGTLTEKDVLNKIMNSKGCQDEKSSKVVDRMYGSIGIAVIHPPAYFNLPDTMIIVHKVEKQSSFGEEDAITVFLWLETQKGYSYVPVAVAGDNPRSHTFIKKLLTGAPAGQNVQLIKKDEIEIRVHGNALFAGWTMPIPLHPKQYTLPPACILIEGYGDAKTNAYTVAVPSGYNVLREQNYFDAFVTFFHPASEYSGPGTDGYFIRDSVQTTYSS